MTRNAYQKLFFKSYIESYYEQDTIENNKEFVNSLREAFYKGICCADSRPNSPWISVKNDLPCNHESYIRGGIHTSLVLVMVRNFYKQLCFMKRLENGEYIWVDADSDQPVNDVVEYWMPIPTLE